MAAAEMAQCTVEAIPTAMNEGMLVSGIILAISFIGIFTETLHGFHRVKVAMLGAGAMVVVGQMYGFIPRVVPFRQLIGMLYSF